MSGLPRYGLQWNGPREFVATPLPDGYWTPHHLAQAEIQRLAHAELTLNDMLNRQIDHTKEARAEVERLTAELAAWGVERDVANGRIAALEWGKADDRFTVRKRDPRTDPPPCDGTQIVYGFGDGVVLAGDAHWAWRKPTDPEAHGTVVDPDIIWWFNAERDLVWGALPGEENGRG
jgi:hypothetical protein